MDGMDEIIRNALAAGGGASVAVFFCLSWVKEVMKGKDIIMEERRRDEVEHQKYISRLEKEIRIASESASAREREMFDKVIDAISILREVSDTNRRIADALQRLAEREEHPG